MYFDTIHSNCVWILKDTDILLGLINPLWNVRMVTFYDHDKYFNDKAS